MPILNSAIGKVVIHLFRGCNLCFMKLQFITYFISLNWFVQQRVYAIQFIGYFPQVIVCKFLDKRCCKLIKLVSIYI